MGMPITVDVRDPNASAGALDDVYADFVRIDELFSPFRPESEVSRIRDGRLAIDDAGPLMHEVLELCRAFERDTDGYFNVWHEGKLDPSGAVKGWAIGRGAASTKYAALSSLGNVPVVYMTAVDG